jgi:hypothetical protein
LSRTLLTAAFIFAIGILSYPPREQASAPPIQPAHEIGDSNSSQGTLGADTSVFDAVYRIEEAAPANNGSLQYVYYYRGRHYPYRYRGMYFNHRYYRGGRWRYYV